jgi:hypothetical protein
MRTTSRWCGACESAPPRVIEVGVSKYVALILSRRRLERVSGHAHRLRDLQTHDTLALSFADSRELDRAT